MKNVLIIIIMIQAINHCTNKDCPSEYSKLIEGKNRCIDDCKNDNIYQYEYQNKCYKECPEGSIKNDNIQNDDEKY